MFMCTELIEESRRPLGLIFGLQGSRFHKQGIMKSSTNDSRGLLDDWSTGSLITSHDSMTRESLPSIGSMICGSH